MAARVVFLHELEEESEHLGKKVNDLIHLISHGFEVAQSFVITHQAYLDFLKENNLDNKVKHLLSTGLDKQITKHLDDSKLPGSLVNELLKAYKNLGTVLDDIEVKINGEKIRGDATLVEKIKQVFVSSYPTDKLNIVVQKVHFGKHGKVRTSSKFINSIHPFSDSETTLLEDMLSNFMKVFYLPHEIDFTLEKGKVIINMIKPETHIAMQDWDLPETHYKITGNSHY